MPRENVPSVKLKCINGHNYYVARITIYRKTYKTTFPYTDEGYEKGLRFIENTKISTNYKNDTTKNAYKLPIFVVH